jgi:glucose uptake protein GlcU
MKTVAYIIMLLLCVGIAVMNYRLNEQPRKEQLYNFKKGLFSAIILAVLASLIYWL